MSTEPVGPNSDNDLYVDFPHLPGLSLDVICGQPQDSLAGALNVAMLREGIDRDQFVHLLSGASGRAPEEIGAEVVLLMDGLATSTPAIVSQFSQVLNRPAQAIYRAALFLKQQEQIPELESAGWKVERKLEGRNGSAPEIDTQ